MSSPSPSSSSPPPPPPPGGSPPPPGPPPPSGSPPPPPPPSTPVTSTNYFFGFVITFVVLLLLFIGCGLGSWRRFRLFGAGWDAHLQDIEGNPFTTRKRARRRLVRPTFTETWTSPASLAHIAGRRWQGVQVRVHSHTRGPTTTTFVSMVQPVSTALVWSRSTLIGSIGRRRASAESPAVAMMRAYVCPRRQGEPSRPPPVQRPPPEAIQVAFMIAMPSQASGVSGHTTGEQCYVGQSGAGEYEIGVIRIPWPSGRGP